MKLLNNKKIQVIALFSLILALLSLSVASDIVPGVNGTNGTNGSDGAPGTPGSPGTPGADGVNGTNGTNGTNGSAGSDGSAGAPGVNGSNAVSFSGGVVFYLHNTTSNSSIPSKEMNRTIRADLPTTYLNITSLENGNTNLINFSSSQLLINFIPGGLYQLHIHGMKTTAGGAHTNTLYYELWVTNSTGGNASYIGTSLQSSVILNGVDNSDAINSVLPDRDFNTTDRLVIKIFASQTGFGLLPNFQLFFDGLTDSRFIVPSSALTPAQLTSIVEPLLNHSGIFQLDYMSSGHTGFASQPDLNTKVNKSGDTMTGNLNFSSSNIKNVTGITVGFEVNSSYSTRWNQIRIWGNNTNGDAPGIDLGATASYGNQRTAFRVSSGSSNDPNLNPNLPFTIFSNTHSSSALIRVTAFNAREYRVGCDSIAANLYPNGTSCPYTVYTTIITDNSSTAAASEKMRISGDGNITLSAYTGSGNVHACIYANGTLYRGTLTGC